jgi:hypothetical protein
VVIASKDLSNKIEATKEAFEKESEGFADLSPYQIAVEIVDEDSARQKGEAIDLMLTLVDRSGDIAQPALALQLKTLTQDGQEIAMERRRRPLPVLPDSRVGRDESIRDGGLLFWRSGNGGRHEGTAPLFRHGRAAHGSRDPPDGSEIALSFVIMPPREPVDKSKPTILPMELNSGKYQRCPVGS